MTRSTVFKSNRSQAVRLPKPVAFPDGVHQVEVIKLGDSRLISPVGRRWDDLFQNGPHASEDFMTDRHQPKADRREAF
ncbi:MAG: antitoxin [Proteobacteria bacterium]|nr:antitoxin [Pseudomonadota bacterium]